MNAIILINSSSTKFVKEYAQKHNLQIEIANNSNDLLSYLKKYERSICVQDFIVFLKKSPNLLDFVPDDKIGVSNEKIILESGIKIFNTDVFCISQKNKNLFKPISECLFIQNYYNQTELSFLFENKKDIIYNFSYRFNRIPDLDVKTGEHRLSSYFINYRSLLNLAPIAELKNIIQQDLDDYENNNYYKGYKIAVRVSGGLGDLVAAEPTVRYICEKLYKNDEVIIVTYAPELFLHIDRPKFLLTDSIPNANSYYVIDTLIGSSNPHPIHGVVSPLLVHACTYASISAIRAELPIEDRSIKLAIKWDAAAFAILKLGTQEYEDLVLVHMGRSWPSKTIPDDVWDSYLIAIKETGKTPVLVGKDLENDFRGVAKNVNIEGCIDLRNGLEIGELVALVAKIPVLISNDSFPIHIAGAFDNYIGLIATCKNPDFILPYRNGDIYYKAKNLTKIPMHLDYEARPNFIEGSRVDHVEENRLRECLPTPEDIKEFVNKCFNKE